MGGYFKATRHPWPCLLFLLPFLCAYEGGLLWLGGKHPDALRNGADTWLRWGLETFGLPQLYWAPALVAIFFFLWSWRRVLDKPRDSLSVCTGMAIESVAFAIGLWALSRELNPLLKSFGVVLQTRAQAPSQQQVLAQVITFVGAGIYEEILFRLLLFGGLIWVFKNTGFLSLFTLLFAAVASAALFSAAHHAGPNGEPFNGYAFLFRTLAGLYFTLLFRLRGFGVAVGTHACYDVLVGIIAP